MTATSRIDSKSPPQSVDLIANYDRLWWHVRFIYATLATLTICLVALFCTLAAVYFLQDHPFQTPQSGAVEIEDDVTGTGIPGLRWARDSVKPEAHPSSRGSVSVDQRKNLKVASKAHARLTEEAVNQTKDNYEEDEVIADDNYRSMRNRRRRRSDRRRTDSLSTLQDDEDDEADEYDADEMEEMDAVSKPRRQQEHGPWNEDDGPGESGNAGVVGGADKTGLWLTTYSKIPVSN